MKKQEIIQHISDWLAQYAQHAHAKGYVVGISGGIDSALVSTLCAQTGLGVLCLTMPIRQKADQLVRATQHIDWLEKKFPNVRSQSIDLSQTFELFEQTVSNNPHQASQALAFANSRSRLRMMTLYYFGQINGLLVAGTGNKIEDFGVGFFTKYGDGGVDVSPIADLTKTQVYELSKELGIHHDIIQAVPTDGLWDEERTDEQQMGATYPELEWAMEQVSLGKTREDFADRELQVFDIYTRLNRLAQHKIQPIPVCLIPDEWK